MRPMGDIVGGELLERIQGDARPSERVLQIVGVAVVTVVIRADVEKHATAAVLEEVAYRPLFDISRKPGRPVLLLNGTDFTEGVFGEISE